jgi:hypothetical protein
MSLTVKLWSEMRVDSRAGAGQEWARESSFIMKFACNYFRSS